jgi:hypothetical protein
MINQIPYGVLTGRTGEFFLQASDFFNCFDEFTVSHDRSCQGFSSVWYDAINMNES